MELLQFVLLLDGGGGAAGADGGGVRAGERRVGVGVRDPDHRHVRLRRSLRGRLPAVRQDEARRQPAGPGGAGCCRRLQEEECPSAGGSQSSLRGQGARRRHLHHREASPHKPIHVINN